MRKTKNRDRWLIKGNHCRPGKYRSKQRVHKKKPPYIHTLKTQNKSFIDLSWNLNIQLLGIVLQR